MQKDTFYLSGISNLIRVRQNWHMRIMGLTDILIMRSGLPIFHHSLAEGFSVEHVPLTSGLLSALLDLARFLDSEGLSEIQLGKSLLIIREIADFKIVCRVDRKSDLKKIQPMFKAMSDVLEAFVSIFEDIDSYIDLSEGFAKGLDEELVYIINTKYSSRYKKSAVSNLILAIEGGNIHVLGQQPTNFDQDLLTEIFKTFSAYFRINLDELNDSGFFYLKENYSFVFVTKLATNSTRSIYLARILSHEELPTAYISFQILINKAKMNFKSILDVDAPIEDIQNQVQQNYGLLNSWSQLDNDISGVQRITDLSEGFEIIEASFGNFLEHFVYALLHNDPIYFVGNPISFKFLKLLLFDVFPYLSISEINSDRLEEYHIRLISQSYFIDMVSNQSISPTDFIYDLDERMVIKGKTEVFAQFVVDQMKSGGSRHTFEILYDMIIWFSHKVFSLLSLNTNPTFILDDNSGFFDSDEKPAAELLASSLRKIAFAPQFFT